MYCNLMYNICNLTSEELDFRGASFFSLHCTTLSVLCISLQGPLPYLTAAVVVAAIGIGLAYFITQRH